MPDFEVTFVTKVYTVYRIEAEDEWTAAEIIEVHGGGQLVDTWSDGEEEFHKVVNLDA